MARVKLELWNEDKTRQEVLKRYKAAAKSKEKLERQWRENESAVYGNLNMSSLSSESEDIDASSLRMDVSYISKNVRFIHAQMSANPPSVQMRPATSDQDDQRKAASADIVARYAARKYLLQEKFDQMTLSTIIRGTGILKTIYDPTKGEILSYDREKQEIELEGDITVIPVNPYNIFPDPDATCTPEIKWVIERIYMDFDEALIQFPDKKKQLEAARLSKAEAESILYSGKSKSDKLERFNTVELLEYWETGLASNGYMGRYCLTTANGEPLSPCESSPFRFRGSGAIAQILKDETLSDEEKEKQIENAPEKADLPYHILTDIDVPESIWGTSIIERALNLQDKLEKIDSTYLDNIAAHGSVKLVVPESATIDDSMTNSPWDIIKIPGNQPPYHFNPPQLMPEMSMTRNNIIDGINESMGVNESMFGQQSRETAGTAMQFATNQGNMIRRRLFNKYVLITESVYRSILNLARRHWLDGKLLSVVGRENALESREFRSVDIDGGYDVVGEYGATFSLDPITRRNEIIQLSGLYREAGIPVRSLLKFMRISEVQSLHDELEYAESRQREIFELIIASGQPIAPKEQMDHENMIAYAFKYFMTAEFNSLPDEIQALCKQHNKDRISLAAQEKSGITGQEAMALTQEATPGISEVVAPVEAPPTTTVT